MKKIFINLQVDCEATQKSIENPDLGERAVRGIVEVLDRSQLRGTFCVIPSDLQIHRLLYQEIESQGHEIALHVHPSELGYDEFLGTYGYDDQIEIIGKAANIFAECMGRKPVTFTPGYCSANDHTFPVLEKLGFKQGTVSMPTRNLPQCACVWGNSPLEAHYPHRHNRCLPGDVDFVDIPCTVDTESRMWGGAHPQDLRVELVDAKNHWYTIEKNVKRLLKLDDEMHVRHIKLFTHNTFDYSDERNFRRETLLGMIEAVWKICESHDCEWVPATTAEIGNEYRKRVPLPENGVKLELDVRGRR